MEAPAVLPGAAAPEMHAGDILVVDDTPFNLRLLSELLTKRGYHVRVATSGEQGLQSIQEALPDLILLDVMMPDLGGYDVCRRLKADPRTAGIPVIFISALGSADDKVEGFNVGGVDYLTKPFQGAEVLARVTTHLARTRAEAALEDNARQLELARQEAEARAVEIETLRQASAAVAATLRQDEMVERILEQLARVVPYDAATVQLLRGAEFEVVGGRGRNVIRTMLGRRIPLSKDATSRQVYETRRVLYLPNVPAADPIFQETAHAGIRSWLAVPLVIRDKCIGMLTLDSGESDHFTHRHIELAQSFADQVAIAFENARAYIEVTQRAEELETISRIGLAITAGLETRQVLQTLFEQCRQVAQIDSFHVALYDEVSGLVQFPLFYDRGQYRLIPPRDIRVRPGLTGYIIRTQETLYLPDSTRLEPRVNVEVVRTGEPYTRSYVGVPLRLRGQVVGVISMQSYQPNAYTAEQIRMLQTVAIQAAITIEKSRLYDQAQLEIVSRRSAERSLREANERLQEQLRQNEQLQVQLREQAIRDAVTGLFNRRYLEETLDRELARAERRDSPISIIMMDIDHFKVLNDEFGHKAGDLMLKAIGEMLRAQTRQADVACRYGGEEFVVVMAGAELEEAANRAEGLRASVESLRVSYEYRELRATVSVGVAAYPAHGHTTDIVLRAADAALYAAKAAGRNRVNVFIT